MGTTDSTGTADGGRSLPDPRTIGSWLLAVVVTELVGASGSVFTSMGLESWYPSLTRPPLTPPNWVIGPVWVVLFALVGTAAWLVYRSDAGRDRTVALGAFAGQFVLNVAWSAAFFGLQSTAVGLAVIVALWLAILGTIAAFDRVDRRASALLVPYLLWVTFAGYLNLGFFLLN
ncbi:TspO protein [Halobacteriales archaeon QS_8_69_26]|nr:MAG: TspO protein [Halobacteriales archaeon QS_8_69_26]